MKNLKYALAKAGLFCLLIGMPTMAISQTPPPPDGSNDDSNSIIPGGGAPVGTGLFVLLGLGLAYGSRKMYTDKQSSHS